MYIVDFTKNTEESLAVIKLLLSCSFLGFITCICILLFTESNDPRYVVFTGITSLCLLVLHYELAPTYKFAKDIKNGDFVVESCHCSDVRWVDSVSEDLIVSYPQARMGDRWFDIDAKDMERIKRNPNTPTLLVTNGRVWRLITF